ncbi:hypothetical protein C9J22_04645 [Photobacterium phosphoreum]|uniref:nucleoid-associated protein n=1 Tax=Photobacterium phosphoreum TaxID=659 RepID=UPI000D16EEBE|nr:nucleoid-associated protein [Photobacterium phosphoreum]PSU73231.1 hypothetical protein C9J22_04645 [Photobacterium phosphoreum]
MVSIELNKIIIHELVKEKNEQIQPLIIRDHVLSDKSQSAIDLVKGIVELYGKKNNSSQYGIFRQGIEGGHFPDNFKQYYQLNDCSDSSFYSLTKVAMGELYSRAENVGLATGGYVLFADYNHTGDRFLLAAMVKQKPGYKITGTLDLEHLEYIDLSRLYQAARVNFSKYEAHFSPDQEEEINYLSFVSPGGNQTASGYFIHAFGCEKGSPSAKATEAVINGSWDFFTQHDDLKKKAYDFNDTLCQLLDRKVNNKESVKLSDIEHIARQYFPADSADILSEEFLSYLNSEDIGVPSEFIVNKQKLHKMTHVVYNSDDLKLSFDKEDLGSTPSARFYFDAKSETLTISELPVELLDILTKSINN